MATGVWLAVVLSGLIVSTSRSVVPSIVEKAAQGREQEANVMAYLRTGDIAVLRNKPMLAIPYPSAERLAGLLSDPTVRMALPLTVRPADIDEKSLLERTVLRGRFHGFVDRAKVAIINLAPILFGLGIALVFVAGLCSPLGAASRGKP